MYQCAVWRRRRRDTHLASVSLAALEHAGVVVRGHVPRASHNVVDVLAQRGGARAVLAGPEAKLGVGHEVCPLVHLGQLAEGTREDQTADGVPCERW